MKCYIKRNCFDDTVFLTSEENRIVILLTIWPRVGKSMEGLHCFYVKKKKSFSNGKHETERRTALTHYLGQITQK